MFKQNKILSFVAGAGLACASAFASTSAMADTLTGAGGTAIYPVLSDWAVAY
jgi:ABC-type phosphate transport system substrate-binding protein